MTDLIVREEPTTAVAAMVSNLGGGYVQGERFNPPLRMRGGKWTLGYGSDEVPMTPADQLGVLATSFHHGHIFWVKGGGKVASRVMVPAHVPMPRIEELPVVEEEGEWAVCLAFSGEILTGAQKFQKYTYEQSNHGGTQAIKKVGEAIGLRVSRGEEKLNPIITLGAQSYTNKLGNKVWNPLFTIVNWA
jgi:hypothetical protein